MKRVTVQFDVEVPDEATDEEIHAWVSFNVGATGGLRADNPMANSDLDAISDTVQIG